MNTVISNIISLPGDLWSKISPSGPSRADANCSAAVQDVITKKEGLIEACLADQKKRFHPITGSCAPQIIHDVFNASFVVFTTLEIIKPSIVKLAPVLVASSAFGFIGAILNVVVGVISIREAIQAFENGDKGKGVRLLVSGIATIAVGAFMLVATLSTIVSFGALSVFLAANPWILPVLIVLVMLPFLYEVVKSNKEIFSGQDPFAGLSKVEDLLNKDIVNWQQLKEHDYFAEILKAARGKQLSSRIEVLQSKMGPRGALASFKVFQAILDNDQTKARTEMKKLRKEATLWRTSQYVRMAQQILFIASTVVSLIALRRADSRALQAVDNGLMLGGMGLPLYMDAFWPLLRNVPIIIPKIKTEE
ncbi:MAG: hypothetical protein P0S96_04830 [Simkaniaceae bacterium]|nr:hypothetical protein [Candidatus Sacchlamyda saccharinae]